jgi:hypothetical protein
VARARAHASGSRLLSWRVPGEKGAGAVHLYEDKGLRGEQISGALTHLRHHIDVNLEQTEFLSEVLVRKARKACGCSTEEIKALLTAKLASSKHPMVLEMVNWLRGNLWDGRGWEPIDHLDKKVVYLSICLGMDAGPRVSNLPWQDKKTAEDHCVRAKDVTANIMLSPTSAFSKIMGGPRLHEHLLAYDKRVHPGVQHKFPTSFPHIIGLELVFLTSKTSRATRLTLPKPIALQRRSERESRLVDNLLLWFLHASKLQEEDPLFRRYHPLISNSLLPRRKPIAAAIKASAAALGFDQSRFSTKSMRSGFATTATANGMSAVERNYRGGWTEGSLVPGLHYARNADSMGVFALEGAQAGHPSKFVVPQLQRLAVVPVGVGSSPKEWRNTSS